MPPTPTGLGFEMARGGNPTVIFDSKRKNVVLHFNRGKEPIWTKKICSNKESQFLQDFLVAAV